MPSVRVDCAGERSERLLALCHKTPVERPDFQARMRRMTYET